MADVTTKTNGVAQNAAQNATSEVAQQQQQKQSTRKAPGLQVKRMFTKPGVSPYNEVEWELRTANISDASGGTIFEQKDVEVPKDWSMTATNIVASKYLHGKIGSSERETGVRQLITRVAETIRDWGITSGYFRSSDDAATFHDELVHLLVNQKMAFNSPVWFNVGCDRIEPDSDAANWHWAFEQAQARFGAVGYTRPQCSACFINSVQDSLDSILTLAKTEGMLFKWGSGTGSNLSPLRSSNEALSGGGTASGPLSFMKGFDAFAGVIKSGGKTRRAAKMVILNVEHPDINEFIDCKAKEEAKAWTLIQNGYDGSSPDSEAYSSIFFQNANNSVRVTDEFMLAVERDGDFSTKAVRDGRVVATYKSRDIMRKIAEATWSCGDPGMQYDTTINRWHTSKNTARINASNPCSEYMFLDDSACNLASLNLMKFTTPSGAFDVDSYRHAVDITITAQEILVDWAGYPTESIMRNSHDYRPLGLGYANLGALLMANGLPYDSDAGRDYAACVTAIMCGEAYLQSARIAEQCPALAPAGDRIPASDVTGGACPGFYPNREPFLDVIRMHRASVNRIGQSLNAPGTPAAWTGTLATLIESSKDSWDQALQHGEKHGYRNAQVTVLAPTGTIGFMMDCDTTGVEPDLALVKYKKLVGGGMIKIVNQTVPSALFKLGYTGDQANAIVSYIDATGTIEGAPFVKEEHLPVFDCSFKPSKGTRSIAYMGHVKMMSAAQPFLSGAISKTVNMPENATVEEITEAYLQSWKMGLKAVAIYRDGSKKSQPLMAKGGVTHEKAAQAAVVAEPVSAGPPKAVRRKLADERLSVTHKFSVGGHDGYITVGLYEDGTPGEIFITMAKEGSTVSGLMDSFATATSIALQHGVPLKLMCEKFAHSRFEPSGWTNNPEIGFAKSIMDYIFRWLHLRFLTGQQQSLFDGLRPKYLGEPLGGKMPAGSGMTDERALASGTMPPQGGMAPEFGDTGSANDQRPTTKDRGLMSGHAADMLRDHVDMGDAPSCHVCGAIMVRNGSCYRCMSCGSTSGCS
ncbi:MAG: vitamin B12-dependent ribonucleotide reductase [Acidobacteriota bacterium]|nr:vitamin B12-dependent ribonucleotide reductase [Acidobacteriota bacterium]